MKKILFIVALSFLAAGCKPYFKVSTPPPPASPLPSPVACTQEAKQCPDGSYVNRSGPNCEFKACPADSGNPPAVCPQIARACPDGSYVHPQGPQCEIPACPGVNPPTGNNLTSGITGTISIGPSCPVQRDPPDPACADRPYQATVVVKTSDGKKEITRFTSNTDGTFKVGLTPATYLLVPLSPQVLPRGAQQTVVVTKDKFTAVNIMYDSGIR